MRQMPAGQWVAFEGYDKVHRCTRAPRSSPEHPVASPGVRGPGVPQTEPAATGCLAQLFSIVSVLTIAILELLSTIRLL